MNIHDPSIPEIIRMKWEFLREKKITQEECDIITKFITMVIYYGVEE